MEHQILSNKYQKLVLLDENDKPLLIIDESNGDTPSKVTKSDHKVKLLLVFKEDKQ